MGDDGFVAALQTNKLSRWSGVLLCHCAEATADKRIHVPHNVLQERLRQYLLCNPQGCEGFSLGETSNAMPHFELESEFLPHLREDGRQE